MNCCKQMLTDWLKQRACWYISSGFNQFSAGVALNAVIDGAKYHRIPIWTRVTFICLLNQMKLQLTTVQSLEFDYWYDLDLNNEHLFTFWHDHEGDIEASGLTCTLSNVEILELFPWTNDFRMCVNIQNTVFELSFLKQKSELTILSCFDQWPQRRITAVLYVVLLQISLFELIKFLSKSLKWIDHFGISDIPKVSSQ